MDPDGAHRLAIMLVALATIFGALGVSIAQTVSLDSLAPGLVMLLGALAIEVDLWLEQRYTRL